MSDTLELVWSPGEANPKQQEFFNSRTLYTAYGGAKGGGKTWAVRVKACGGALANPGIRILIMRKTYPELEENHIRPILSMLPKEIYAYNGSKHTLTFGNGSYIKFGHWQEGISENEYQGLEYDWIFLDEATQFTERAFRYLGGCLRGSTPFPKRFYITCNPGGVGHRWVKRLFIDRNYDVTNPIVQAREKPENYSFIFASVYDNKALLDSSPTYLQTLASMPKDLVDAYLNGNWDAIGGNYFPEFSEATHVVKPFKLPPHWKLYRSFDYGLDMFACYWWAVDEDGRMWGIREFCEPKLIVQQASERMHENTLPTEKINGTYAPPDMWNRQKDTGRTMAEVFMINGVGLIKADNNRVQGHMMVKESLAMMPVNDPYVKQMFPGVENMPGLMFFDNCKEIINDIRDIQADDNNPNDCAKEPHDITHTVDAVRYFCVSRKLASEALAERRREYEERYDDESSYEYSLTGGEFDSSYLNY